jgi:hypothetical protein
MDSSQNKIMAVPLLSIIEQKQLFFYSVCLMRLNLCLVIKIGNHQNNNLTNNQFQHKKKPIKSKTYKKYEIFKICSNFISLSMSFKIIFHAFVKSIKS